MIPAIFLLSMLQQSTPEQVFRNIEATLNKAPCLRVEFSYQSVSLKEGVEDLRADVSGTLVVKDGDKVRATIPLPGKLPPAILIADGQQLSCTWRGIQRTQSCSGSRKWLSSAFARAGAYRGTSCYALLVVNAPKMIPDVESEIPITDLVFAEVEKGGGSLTYLVTLGAGHETVKTQLWYDPATYLPTKRVIWLRNPEHRITEMYSEVSSNADVPANQFTLTPENVKPR